MIGLLITISWHLNNLATEYDRQDFKGAYSLSATLRRTKPGYEYS